MSAAVRTKPLTLTEFVCPECAKRNMRRILVRATPGSVVEVYCRSCKLRRVVRLS